MTTITIQKKQVMEIGDQVFVSGKYGWGRRPNEKFIIDNTRGQSGVITEPSQYGVMVKLKYQEKPIYFFKDELLPLVEYES